MHNDELFEERSHGKLKYSFRLGMDADTGHRVKIVFEFHPKNVMRVGDGTSSLVSLSDEEEEKIRKNIGKTGYADFVSREKCVAIIDLDDNNRRLKEVRSTGAMSGMQEFFNKPLEERERAIKNGAFFGGTKYFKVGQMEDTRPDGTSTLIKTRWGEIGGGSFKSTRPAYTTQDLHKFQMEPLKYGRGYHPESTIIFNENDLMDYLFIESDENNDEIDCGLKKLPEGLSHLITVLNKDIKTNVSGLSRYAPFNKLDIEDIKTIINLIEGKGYDSEIGHCIIKKQANGNYSGEIHITPMPEDPILKEDKMKILNKLFKNIEKRFSANFEKDNPGKKFILTGPKDRKYFIIALKAEYAKKLYEYITSNGTKEFTEKKQVADIDKPEPQKIHGDMSVNDAKRVLRNVSHGIITDKNKEVNQYTANIYANIITKNLLPVWAPSFRKFSIQLTDESKSVEFKIPKMTQDFISRYINGRETLDGLLHRQTEIKMKIPTEVFHTMENPDDAYNFFNAAINYYDKKVTKAANKLMAEVMKLNHPMKHLICTSKLSGLVVYPMTLLFSFNNVHMNDKKVFTISNDDIQAVSSFIKNISSSYAAPDKEKSVIINDVKKMVKELRESVSMDDNLREIAYLPQAISALYEGDLNDHMNMAKNKWIDEQVDKEATRDKTNVKAYYLREAFGVKKLKKIPIDLVAYIQIEAEAIKDANDKLMIASYCLGKIEIVEWYIELIETGNKKYIVPHTKTYLESVRTQLLACYKKIMSTPAPKSYERPLIDIKYPKGYEG